MVLNLTKSITQQVLETQGLIPSDMILPDFSVEKGRNTHQVFNWFFHHFVLLEVNKAISCLVFAQTLKETKERKELHCLKTYPDTKRSTKDIYVLAGLHII